MSEGSISHSRLVELLAFDEATGVLTWRKSPSNSVKAGARAGVFHPQSGGRYVNLDGKRYMAHRVAWFYVKKEWPKYDLRPINGNFDDCRIENLQDVPRQQIAHQRSALKTNTSGFLGVSRSNKKGKWQASITWNYVQINLGGNFETPEEASEIYEIASSRLKEAKTEEDRDRIIAELRLFRRQRSAWKHLLRTGQKIGWQSFEDFTNDVKEFATGRYALAPIDVALPIGPGNFRWAVPSEVELNSSADRRIYVRARVSHNRDLHRAKHLMTNYGADVAYERKLLVEQQGLCAICQKPEVATRGRDKRCLSLDHDHKTGALRGLLCGNCNLGLGYFCDDPEVLLKAIGYLEKYSKPPN